MIKQFITSCLQFQRVVKKVEKFKKAELESVYTKWCEINHKHLSNCKKKPKNI